MLAFIFGLVFAALTVCFVAVYRAYDRVAARELKRRARQGDEVAALLFRMAAYGVSSKVLLIGLALVSGYIALALLNAALGIWMTGFVLIVLGLAGAVFVQSNGGMNRVSVWLAAKLSQPLGWLVEHLHPVFDLIGRLARRLMPLHVHTGMYEKDDLAELLEHQKAQPDNRIAHGEIDLLAHALRFGDKTVLDTLVPKRVVKSVSVGESIGPVLMGELHATGHSRFPVYDGRKDHIVGVLYLHDLIARKKQTGTIADVMRTPVRYVHEQFTLYDTLQAFLKTKQHLFVVVNSFEEYVGIITIEDIVEQIIGKPIVDEFDQYDDLRAVAAKAAAKEHAEHKKHEVEAAATPTPEQTEVVE